MTKIFMGNFAGPSNYQRAIALGEFTGTEEEYLASLVGDVTPAALAAKTAAESARDIAVTAKDQAVAAAAAVPGLQGDLEALEASLPGTYVTKIEVASRAPKSPALNVDAAVMQNVYDAGRNIYNLKASNMRRARSAAARAQLSGGQFFRFAATGDSQVGGEGSTPGLQAWPRQLSDLMAKQGRVIDALGGVAVAYKANAADERYTTPTGGWSAFVINATQTSAARQASGAPNPLIYTSTTPGTAVEIQYYKGGAVFTLNLDGADYTITPESGSGWGVHRATGLANTTHVVKISPSANNLIIGYVAVRDNFSGMSIMNAGIGGSTARQWASPLAYAAKAQVKAWAPHLVTVGLGTNDKIAGRSTAEFKADMATIIADYLTASDVVITTPVNGNGLDLSGYRVALYELADQFDIPLIDVGDRLGTYAQAQANGLMVDAYHVVPGANYFIALAVASILN